MTRTQRRIVAYIRLSRGRVVNAYELRDMVVPGRCVENIKVQVHRARRGGEHRICSKSGSHGGYWWEARA